MRYIVLLFVLICPIYGEIVAINYRNKISCLYQSDDRQDAFGPPRSHAMHLMEREPYSKFIGSNSYIVFVAPGCHIIISKVEDKYLALAGNETSSYTKVYDITDGFPEDVLCFDNTVRIYENGSSGNLGHAYWYCMIVGENGDVRFETDMYHSILDNDLRVSFNKLFGCFWDVMLRYGKDKNYEIGTNSRKLLSESELQCQYDDERLHIEWWKCDYNKRFSENYGIITNKYLSKSDTLIWRNHDRFLSLDNTCFYYLSPDTLITKPHRVIHQYGESVLLEKEPFTDKQKSVIIQFKTSRLLGKKSISIE